jgi:trehalose 6-phosphate phosphatase
MRNKYLFNHLDTVAELLSRFPFGLITDVDGTISEIAPSPQEARVSPLCREQLTSLTGHLELVAAISGRPAIEVKEMVGVGGIVYIGNHGLERWCDGAVVFVEGLQRYTAKVIAVQEELGSLLAIEGIALENKGVALAIHYRLCPDRERARQAIREKIASSAIARDFRILEGKMVVELRPPAEVNKGTAVRDLVEKYQLKGGVYMGDDVSDLDAFAVMHQEGFCSLGIIADETPEEVKRRADFTLNGVGDAERFLKWFAGAAPGLKQ